MTFFERQQAARRNTKWMIVLFLVALAGIVLAVDVVASLTWLWLNAQVLQRSGSVARAVPAWVHVWSVLLTGGTILGVSLWEDLRLRAGGGAAVARMVGARRVLPSTADRLERRLLNVVEEMAIASGARVPAVYVMDEEHGINAFAAGCDVSNAVVAVTRGALDTLNRDELQGVIGHEFSHIVNGDMALNIRLIGVLAGIVFLGAVGGFVMRTMRGRGRDTTALFLIGLSLFVIGYIGVFFARLIKAGVARERERLADDCGVQYTRNPDGLAGALDQIRASSQGSLIASRRAEDMSHLFFGEGIALAFESLFATHPPLEERIERIHPHFQSSGYRDKRPTAAASLEAPEEAVGFAGTAGAAPPAAEARAGDVSQAWGRSPKDSAALVGAVDDRKVIVAKRILASIPPSIRERTRHADGACAILVALLLARKDDVMARQLEALRTQRLEQIAADAAGAADEMRLVGPSLYLPIIDLALPAAKQATPAVRAGLLQAMDVVINADRRVSMFEFVALGLVRAQLMPRAATAPAKYKSLKDVRDEIALVLSLAAHAGALPGEDMAERVEAAFRAGAAEMDLEELKLLDRKEIALDDARTVLDKLRDLAPLPKAILMRGLFATVTADGTIRIIEAALMRMMGAVLDCPLPPLLEDLDPESLAQ